MSNKDENGVSRWWLREPVDHADAESDKGGDFVMHSDYRRVVDALKDELAGTIKVREAAFVQIARLKADNANLQRVITAQEKWRTQCDEAEQAYHDLRQVKIDLDAEMYRLKADLARVTAQRDRLAMDMQNSVIADNVNSGEEEPQADAVTWMAKVYGLRIVGGTVEEIES